MDAVCDWLVRRELCWIWQRSCHKKPCQVFLTVSKSSMSRIADAKTCPVVGAVTGWLFTNTVISYTYCSHKFCHATIVVDTIRSIHKTGRIARLS